MAGAGQRGKELPLLVTFDASDSVAGEVNIAECSWESDGVELRTEAFAAEP